MSNEEKAKKLFESITNHVPDKKRVVPMHVNPYAREDFRRWESLPAWYADVFRKAVVDIGYEP